MAKKKGIKNPLAQLLGVYFKKERDFRGMSSDSVANQIDIGGSFYRMIESGAANFHPSRSLDIIKVFYKIEFDALCKMLVAIQILESHKDAIEDFQKALEEVGDADPQLAKLFQILEPVWVIIQKKTAKDVKKFLESEPVYHEIKQFLTSNKYYEKETEKRLDLELNALINQTPGFYLELTFKILQILERYPTHILPDDLYKWERENKHEFTNLYAIIKNHQSVSSLENLSNYTYDYLWSSQFEELNFIFLDESQDNDKALQTFKKNLKTVLKRKPQEFQSELQNFDKAISKVSFKGGKEHKEALSKIMLHKDKSNKENFHLYDLLWIFTLQNGNVIGFMSNVDAEQILQRVSLTYKETYEKLTLFKEIGKTIEI